AHTGTADWAFSADNDHVTRLDLSLLNCREGRFLAVKDASRTGDAPGFQPGYLGHRSFGSEIALENNEVARRMQRPVERPHHFLAAAVNAVHVLEVFRQRLAGDGDAVAVQHASFEPGLQHG